MRTTCVHSTLVVLVFLGFIPSNAFGQEQTGAMRIAACDAAAQSTRDHLLSLFKYSQLAERPSDRKGDIWSCRPDALLPKTHLLSIDPKHIDELERTVRRELDGTRNEKSVNVTSIGDTILVSCRVNNMFLAVVLRIYDLAGSLFIEVDTAARDFESRAWAPLQIHGTDGDLQIGFPGTRILDLRQIAANFTGEDCPFPAATFAIQSICEVSRERGLLQVNSEKAFEPKSDRVTIAGHSLGGAAVQHVASAVSESCPHIDAYAFGSIGLTNPTEPQEHVKLESYVSQRDGVGQFFSDNTQTGRITSISRTTSHFIDSIQDDIACCAAGGGGRSVLQYQNNDNCPENPTNSQIDDRLWSTESTCLQ